MLAEARRELDWSLDPAEALRRWPARRPVVMLHSARTHPRWSRWSVLAGPVGGWSFSGTPQRESGARRSNHPFHDLEHLVANDEAMWVGYLGYDLGRCVERIGDTAAADRRWPDAEMARCPGWLVHDRVKRRWWACGAWATPEVNASCCPDLPALPENEIGFRAGPVQPDMTRDQYLARVTRVLDYIAAGDVFQVNLTQRLGCDFAGSTRGFYAALAEQSPAWYGAYLELPGLHDDHSDGPGAWPAVASASPELFFELDPEGTVTTRPIKGTRPADAPREELDGSAKDRAELAMIVDLLRNDLGRVCDYGSVRVEHAREIEHHPTVQHGVATITGRLHRSRGLADLLRAVIPGGSITGSPKVRAMQIIEELEPTRRGPYCGAIGWLRGGGGGRRGVQGAFNLAIRTVLIDRGRAEFGVGGGLVADSDPAAEYAETLTKAAAILTALEAGRDPGSASVGTRQDFATVDP